MNNETTNNNLLTQNVNNFDGTSNIKEDILDNDKLSLIQLNIDSINKILDNNKFTSNNELTKKLQSFTDQVSKINLMPPSNININYF